MVVVYVTKFVTNSRPIDKSSMLYLKSPPIYMGFKLV